MGVKEKSVELHASGLNCAQSVLISLEDYTGLDAQTATAVGVGFGGGVGCGEICGAVSGAVMALGLYSAKKGENKISAKKRIAEFINGFKDEFGYVRCKDLKGGKVSCDTLIAFAAELTEKIINSDKEY